MEDSEKNRYIEFLIQQKEDCPNRQGMRYDTMKATRRILHKSDLSKLPEGAEIIRVYDQKYSFEQKVEIIQHDRQMVVYKTKDGETKTAYLPYDDEDVESFKRVPGTHATSDLIAYIIFNKYLMETPFYRELKRLMEEDMRICDGTLSNWLSKGVPHLKKMIPYLLAMERKNSLFFGNHAKAEMSALYHTFIATCQMMGLSVLKYFKNLFAAIAAGRTDYERSAMPLATEWDARICCP